MTTIAIKNGFLATDSRVCLGDTLLTDGHSSKAVPLKDGGILALTGVMADFASFVKAARKKRIEHLVIDADTTIILARPNGRIRIFHHVPQGTAFYDFDTPPDGVAFGSGAAFAMGAMHAGAGVHRAVEIAAKCDIRTGGSVNVFNIALGVRI